MSTLKPRPGVLEIAPYVGGQSRIDGADRIVKLSSNEGALGPSPAAVEAVRAAASGMHRYPDGGGVALREAIANAHGLDPARIVCGNGSDELIGLLVQAYCGPGTELIHTAHAFLMYAIYAKAHGAVPVAVPEADLTADPDAILAAVTPRTRAVFLANPNNPTGTWLDRDGLWRLREALPESVLLVLDAAYAEFLDDPAYDPGTGLVDAFDTVAMTRTFSKIYGLGGARLGWAYAQPPIIDVLNRVRSPFNVSGLTQAAGIAAVEDRAFVDRVRAHNTRERDLMMARLRQAGLSVSGTAGNFLLAHFETIAGRRAVDADAWLKARGVIVRRMEAYGLPDALRISIGPTDDNLAATAALQEFMQETGG